jgi:hypothetical protein
MRLERRPDDRYQAALRAANDPAQPFESALWQLRHNNVADDIILRVVDAYEDTFERELLQAWIIAGASDEDISTRLGFPVSILAPYRHLCCNLFMFRDKLEMMRWVHLYNGTREGRLLLACALHFDGVEAIAHLCGLPSKLEPEHVNQQAMRETYFRSINTLRASSISSADAIAAHQLLKTATATAAVAAKRNVPSVADTLLKLKHREMTWHAEDVVPHGEILH